MSIYRPQDLERLEARSELVERLREMRWPEPSETARRRSWELLTAQLEDGAEAVPPVAPAPPLHEARDTLSDPGLGRLEFVSRSCARQAGALRERVSATRGLSRRGRG